MLDERVALRVEVRRLSEAERRHGIVNQLQLYLVARHRIGIGGVAVDPGNHLVTLLDQHVAQILIDQCRRVELPGLDDVVLALQRIAQGKRDVALVDGHIARLQRLAIAVDRACCAVA